MYKSVHVCVVHDLRYILRCAIERQLIVIVMSMVTYIVLS